MDGVIYFPVLQVKAGRASLSLPSGSDLNILHTLPSRDPDNACATTLLQCPLLSFLASKQPQCFTEFFKRNFFHIFSSLLLSSGLSAEGSSPSLVSGWAVCQINSSPTIRVLILILLFTTMSDIADLSIMNLWTLMQLVWCCLTWL